MKWSKRKAENEMAEDIPNYNDNIVYDSTQIQKKPQTAGSCSNREKVLISASSSPNEDKNRRSVNTTISQIR